MRGRGKSTLRMTDQNVIFPSLLSGSEIFDVVGDALDLILEILRDGYWGKGKY